MIDRSSLEVGIPFGSGGQTSPWRIDGIPYADLDPHDRARVQGWMNGCPVVEALTDPANGRGPDEMEYRYKLVNDASMHIFELVYGLNPSLAESLNQGTSRNKEEGVGVHETESVPDSFFEEMSPLGTLVGYSLPRLFIEQAGLNEEITPEAREARAYTADRLLRDLCVSASSPESLLARYAESLGTNGDITPQRILGRILPEGWYGEHQATNMLEGFKRELEHSAPSLWKEYESMSPAEKASLKIV